MTDRDEDRAKEGGSGYLIAAAAGALLAVHAGLWFYFRARQTGLDERTRERLGGRRP